MNSILPKTKPRSLSSLNQKQKSPSSTSKIAVLGRGRIGSLVSKQLLQVIGLYPHLNLGIETLDLNDGADFENPKDVELIAKQSALVICCLPVSVMQKHNLKNKPISWYCAVEGTHYIDATEDTDLHASTLRQNDLAIENGATLIPGCGLAPGLINYVAAEIKQHFDSCERLQLMVGALPRHKITKLGYALTWSPEGLLNEYLNDCEIIKDGFYKTIPALSDLIRTNIDGVDLEGFATSGGLGTLRNLEINNLNYRSLRYPGHRDLILFLLDELQLRNDKSAMLDILSKLPSTEQDVVFFQVIGEGLKHDRYMQYGWKKSFTNGNKSALAELTAIGISSVAEQLMRGQFRTGTIQHEEVPLHQLVTTHVFSHNPLFMPVKEIFGVTGWK